MSTGNKNNHPASGGQVHDKQGMDPDVVEEMMRINNELVNFKRQLLKNHTLLSQQEARFRKVIQENPDPVFVLDSTYNVVFLSNAAEELADQFHSLGIGIGNPLPFTVAPSGEVSLSQEPDLNHVFDMAEVETIWDEERAFIVSLRRITERKQAEQDLLNERNFSDAILQTVTSLVVVLDGDGRVVRFNRACEQASGYTFDEVKGLRLWEDLLHPADVKKVKLSLGRLLTGGKDEDNETIWVTKAGDSRLIAWHYSPMPGEGQGVGHVIATGSDITFQREIENHRSRENISLEEMSSPIPSKTTAATLGVGSLRDFSPALFANLIGEYARLMDMAVDMLHFKVDHNVPRGVEKMSEELGTLLAGPRDLTDLFLEALKKNSEGVSPEKSRAYRAEGRILLIELLGKLVQYYRNHCLSGLPQMKTPPFWEKEPGQ